MPVGKQLNIEYKIIFNKISFFCVYCKKLIGVVLIISKNTKF